MSNWLCLLSLFSVSGLLQELRPQRHSPLGIYFLSGLSDPSSSAVICHISRGGECLASLHRTRCGKSITENKEITSVFTFLETLAADWLLVSELKLCAPGQRKVFHQSLRPVIDLVLTCLRIYGGVQELPALRAADRV